MRVTNRMDFFLLLERKGKKKKNYIVKDNGLELHGSLCNLCF